MKIVILHSVVGPILDGRGRCLKKKLSSIEFIAVNGGWGDFSDWSDCSAKCGGGEQSRRRACDNPAPAHGGADCDGDATKTRACNSDPCAPEPQSGQGG